MAAPAQGQVDQVFMLYRKYINDNHQEYNIDDGCSISRLCISLSDWMSKNLDRFDNRTY